MEQTYWTHSSYTNLPHHNLNKKKNPWCYFITCNLTTVFYLVPLLPPIKPWLRHSANGKYQLLVKPLLSSLSLIYVTQSLRTMLSSMVGAS